MPHAGSTTTITSIGGFISNGPGSEKTVLAAIVQLTGGTDLPDSIDLTSSNFLSTTLINVGATCNLYQAATSLTLAPGWYALEFGTNAFGESSIPNSMYMNNFSNDLALSQFVYIAYQAAQFGDSIRISLFNYVLNKGNQF